MSSLDEKVALVTGASRGVGAAVARALFARWGVAEVVVFVLTRPRHFRILDVASRPAPEQSL